MDFLGDDTSDIFYWIIDCIAKNKNGGIQIDNLVISGAMFFDEKIFATILNKEGDNAVGSITLCFTDPNVVNAPEFMTLVRAYRNSKLEDDEDEEIPF